MTVVTGFALIVVAMVALTAVSVPNIASAAAIDDACDGLSLVDPDVNCSDDAAASSGFSGIVKTVVNILSLIVGAASVIMLMIGGFRYIISGGDSNGIQGAKNTILYALVGLVVVLFSQIIVQFVIGQL